MRRISVSVSDETYEELRVRAFHERVAVAAVANRILESASRVLKGKSTETLPVAPAPESGPKPSDPTVGVLRRSEVNPRFKGR